MQKTTLKSKVFINSLIVNIASLIEKSGFFVVNILVARYLSVEHFGEYSTALAYATFFSLMTDIGINITLVRAINLESKYSNEHFTNAFVIKIALAVIMYAAMVLSLYVTNYNRDVINLILILGAVRLCNEFINTYFSIYEAQQKFVFPSIAKSTYVVTFLAGTLAVIVLKGTYYDLAFIRLAVVVFFILMLSYKILKEFALRFNSSLCKQFIATALPFTSIHVLWNLILRTNAIIISFMIGTTQVGIFTNSMVFVDTLSIIPGNIRKVVLPVLYKALEENNRSKFQFTFEILSKYFGIISFYLTLTFILFSKEIITLIFGHKYIKAVPILQVISLSIPFVFNVATVIIVGLDKQHVLSRILLLTTIVNIASNIVLIHFFELLGAAFTIVITYGLIFILGHYYLREIQKMKFKHIVKWYCILVVITLVCTGMPHVCFFKDINFIISLPLVTILYGILVIVFLIRKDDVRIVKEMLFGK